MVISLHIKNKIFCFFVLFLLSVGIGWAADEQITNQEQKIVRESNIAEEKKPTEEQKVVGEQKATVDQKVVEEKKGDEKQGLTGGQNAPKQPVTVNGDTVEFKTDSRMMVAEGNVEVLYQDTILSCDKVKVYMDEKLMVADGHVKFKRKSGEEFRGETVVYDFASSAGTIMGADIYFAPYYGKTGIMEKVSNTEFVMTDTKISSCDLPHPHYEMACSEIKMSPGNSMTAKDMKLSILGVPLMYLPSFSQSLTDKKPTIMIMPGSKSDLGVYFLGSYRYYFNENMKGLLHLNWYQDRGIAEGADLNYNTKCIGLGNVKYFHIDDSFDYKNNPIPRDEREAKDRSIVEVRHKWEIGDRDNLIVEFYRQSDATVRKDFFYREYEKVTNPESYFLYSHVFPNATFSFKSEPRVNKFDTVIERVPELKLETVNQRIQNTSFYFKSISSISELDNAPANLTPTNHVTRADTSNQLAYVFRFMHIDFNPYLGHQDTYFSRGIAKDLQIRDMFFTGLDMSTKLFKTYNVSSDYLGLDIDKLRHVITPGLQYRYQHEPTVSQSLLQQFDAIDTLDRSDMVTLSLENKLQTKRRGESVDLATLLLTSDYDFQRDNLAPTTGFQNIHYKFELKPYSLWEFDSEAEYDILDRFFKTITTDFWTHKGNFSTAFGSRYKKGESSQFTSSVNFPINPFWSAAIYECFEFRTGKLMEQQYTLNRDMHCWTMQFILDQRKGGGVGFYVAFQLKAFPDLGIHAEKTFTPPRSQ